MTTSAPSPARRDYRALRRLVGFVRPYRLQVTAALAALVVAAGTVLVFGAGLRWLIDRGFAAGDPALLDKALIGLLAVIVLLAVSMYGRSYLVSWLGERVTADIRRAVFENLVRLSPGFFETTRTGEVLSRLSTDTTVVQTIVSSSASQALRNILL